MKLQQALQQQHLLLLPPVLLAVGVAGVAGELHWLQPYQCCKRRSRPRSRQLLQSTPWLQLLQQRQSLLLMQMVQQLRQLLRSGEEGRWLQCHRRVQVLLSLQKAAACRQMRPLLLLLLPLV
jgi:hypothetical protein